MITLKDYIGKIYKEITNAKVQSDIETLAIADEYVNNPMLKHFSVPNIRIKNVELTIPVAVDEAQVTTRDYTEREVQQVFEDAFFKVNADFFPNQTADQIAYLDSIKPELSNKAQVYSVSTATDLQAARLQDSVTTAQPTAETDATIKTVEASRTESTSTSELKYPVALKNSADQFAGIAYAYVGSYIEEAAFREAMTLEIESNLQPISPELETLPVIIETQRLKEIDDPASLINIKVNIIDDAMEWTTDIDADGNPVQVLNYE